MPDQPPPAKHARLSAKDSIGETCQILVGSTTTFYIHKSVLHTSKFLQNTIRLDTGKLKFPEERPSVFKLYVSWLYSRNICLSPEREHGRIQTALVLAYVLGEMLMDDAFQNAVLRRLICYTATKDQDGSLSSEEMNVIYNGTTEGSPARGFVVDSFVSVSKGQGPEEKCLDWLHPSLVSDIYDTLGRARKVSGETKKAD